MLIVYDMQSADASQPSIFTPLSFSAYRLCASCTLRSPRAWQSPTAQPGFGYVLDPLPRPLWDHRSTGQL